MDVTPKFNLRKQIRQQICDLIEKQLKAGNYHYQIPTELELAETLQVSRATVREVLSEIAGEGWILRRHGQGTFINPTFSARKTPMTPMPYFLDIIEGYGRKASLRFIDYAVTQTAQQAAAQLQLNANKDLACMKLAYCADGAPRIVCYDYFDSERVNPETFAPMRQCSIFQMLYESAGCVVVWANTVLTSTHSGCFPEVSRLMEVPNGEIKPLLLVKNTCYDPKDHPVLYSESFFDTSLIEFSYVQQYGPGRGMDT